MDCAVSVIRLYVGDIVGGMDDAEGATVCETPSSFESSHSAGREIVKAVSRPRIIVIVI